MSSSEYVTSTGIVGTYVDEPNNRYRGLLPGFRSSADNVRQEWQRFRVEGQALEPAVGRLSLRVVTSPEIAAIVAQGGEVEAFLPLQEDAGVLYVGANAPDRQVQRPVDDMHRTAHGIAEVIERRFRSPLSRIVEMRGREYGFVDAIENSADLAHLWGSSFGWSTGGAEEFVQRLASNSLAAPQDRTLWFTGITYQGSLVGAVMAERLDVPGPDGQSIPIVESTEWIVNAGDRHRGVATAMLTMNTAQCLNDLPNARLFAECRFSSTSYATGMSIGMEVPPDNFCPQILPRNVWVEGELADFLPLYLPAQAVEQHYSPATRQAMLAHLNQD